MAVVYWIGQAPNATVTLAQAIALANLMTTGGSLVRYIKLWST